MNYITHTRAAFAFLAAEPTATPHHVSLYVALFQLWNAAHFPPSVLLFRDELMRAAHIGSAGTYRACLRDLTAWGLITYQPSQSQHHPSQALMHELGPEAALPTATPESAPTTTGSSRGLGRGASRGPTTGQAVPPILKTPVTVTDEENPTDFSNASAAGAKNQKGYAVLDDSLSAEQLAAEDCAGEAPKEKVAPKRKAPGRGGGRPEVLFAESELADPEAFIAAFAGTDFELANLRFYHQKVANWRKDGEPPRRRDWKATAKNFMLNDIERNALVLAPAQPVAGYGTPAHGAGARSAIADYFDSRYA
ncbi:hypothetical protein [Hymenobacter wooponensis]|uniref:Uncharacterized protein n=1 Tax=Hymenobacter wooponensis TaxID=1525360 RepID=A0A4Z0MQ01_9BACT|nr:hypothetical protein [Hymenobacter wooponensis]TGD81721.1 hypothetical protein EU557_09300 [Hymenobacter wooponensis]